MSVPHQASFQEKLAARQKDRVRFDLNHTLNMRPRTGVSTYYVTIEYNKDAEGNQSRCLNFTVDYEFLYRLKETRFVVAVSKYDFFINRQQPSMMMEKIAARIAEAINPIKIIINHRGGFQKIYKMEEIWKRWKRCRKELRKEYEGDVINKIFASLDKKFSNQATFEGSLSKDIFWNLFFTPLYRRYGDTRAQETSVLLPIVSGAPSALFKGTCSVKPELSDHNSVELAYEARASLPGTFRAKRKNKEQPLEASLAANYDLDAKTHLPRLIQASCDVTEASSGQTVKTMDVLISRIEKLKATNTTNKS